MKNNIIALCIIFCVGCSVGNKNLDGLRNSVENNDYEKIEYFASKISKKNQEVFSIVKRAIDKNDQRALQILFDHGIDPNIIDNSGKSLIYGNTDKINESILLLLLKSGFNPSVMVNDNESFLYWALKKEKKDVVEQLLKHNADVNFVKSEGHYSILHIAVFRLDGLFLKEIADRTKNKNVFNGEGYTPLGSAIHDNNLFSAKILIESGADVFKIRENVDSWTEFSYSIEDSAKGIELANQLLQAGLKLRSESFWGLHASVWEGKFLLTKWFVENGAEVNKIDKNGAYPIDYAWHLFTSPDSEEGDQGKNLGDSIMKFLLDNGSVSPDFSRAENHVNGSK